MQRRELEAYFELMESFESGQISAEDFEANYLALFKSDKRFFQEDVFKILNQLFSDVDMFASNPEIRGVDDLDQNQLLECSRKAYRELGSLINKRTIQP